MKDASFLISPSILKRYYSRGFTVPLAVQFEGHQDFWQVAKRAVLSAENAFFLDSVKYQKNTARYSVLGWKPFRIFKARDSKHIISKLRKLFQPYRGRKWDELPFFTGGAVGYFSYELAHEFEVFPDLAKDDLGLDQAALLFIRDLLVYDHKKNIYFLIANLIPAKDGSFDLAFKRAYSAICDMGRSVPGTAGTERNGHFTIRNFKSDSSKQVFKRMVLRAKKYITAGDIYQANLSQRFSFKFKGRPETLYESLRKINPSPFSTFLKIGSLVVASASPERLIKLDGNVCETRPIAGTRPRGETAAQEKRFRRDLMMSPKERAEHIMLVDLERNDLGRVSAPHSVRVSELMTLESYSHVVHIVSNVIGRLKKGQDRFDLLRAVFPGGTITGCPKIRSMEIIEELEPFKRHLYTGSIGYLDFNGDMDLNIVIRSLILHRNHGYLQVGAGIVHDSNPEAEYWETLHKGKALIDALCTSSLRAKRSNLSSQIASSSLRDSSQ
ncbi:MAG: anthranilate synthase component I family protein [Candidatus Omnitrophica bacterium]|nr:anthranilate synthase component I family protein [Candidatus Omnitrophota bacterium]